MSALSGIGTITKDSEGVTASRIIRRTRLFYVVLAVFMVAIMLIGFWPSYFGPLLRGAAARPLVIHVHGIVFVGWMALLLAQVILVAAGQTATHRMVGSIGIAYGGLVLIMGLVVGFAAPIMHLAAGEWNLQQAAGFILVILGDMAMFGGFFLAAVVYRRKPEVHKRMMLLATVALLFAAVGRMNIFEISPLLFATVWLSPVVAGIAYDAVTRRRVHPAYIIGLGVLLIGFSRVLFTESDGWQRIGRSLLAAFN